MRDGFRQSMTWLHTWGGLVFTWLLFAIFFTGTLSFYRDEITAWMQPAAHHAQSAADGGLVHAVALLQQRAPEAKDWSIALPTERRPWTELRWRNDKFDPKAVMLMDPASGQELDRRATLGGTFFRSFHFSLMAGIKGEWVVGAAAMMMLVALISGVIVHKKIFKDLFTFRPDKSLGRSWLDAHNMAAVFSLPFFLLITYTGLVTLMYVYLPNGLALASGSTRGFFAALNPAAEPPKAVGTKVPLGDVSAMLEQVRQRWGELPGGLRISQPGDAAATVDFQRRRGAGISARGEASMRFDGVSGRLLAEQNLSDSAAPARSTYGVFYGLHVAWFADQGLRALLFFMSLAGCLMIASGGFLWAAKRQEQRRDARLSFGERFVNVLNLAGIGGLVVASVAYFWLNRLLPAEWAARQVWEGRGFFIVWLLMLLHAALRSHRLGAAWREQLWLGAALCLLLPVLNAVTGGLSLPEALAAGRGGVAGIDLGALAFAGLLFWLGAKLARPRVVKQKKRARHATALPEPIA